MKKEYLVIYDGIYSSIEKADYQTNQELFTLAEAKAKLSDYAQSAINGWKELKSGVSKITAKNFK